MKKIRAYFMVLAHDLGLSFDRKFWGTNFVWYACYCANHTNI